MLEFISKSPLLLPALLAVIGFFLKSLYEILLENRKRNRQLIESKLQNFYWPICIRLKKNESVFHYLFQGKKSSNRDSSDYKIAHYVEKKILLKSHEEIIAIITSYRHLADNDEEVGPLIDAFIKHVSIYNALIDSGIDEYPGVVSNAPYPKKIDQYFYDKTKALQRVLDKKMV